MYKQETTEAWQPHNQQTISQNLNPQPFTNSSHNKLPVMKNTMSIKPNSTIVEKPFESKIVQWTKTNVKPDALHFQNKHNITWTYITYSLANYWKTN